MKTHSLLFNPEMGQALHEGRKTQTRRILRHGKGFKRIADITLNACEELEAKGWFSDGDESCLGDYLFKVQFLAGDRIIAKEHHWALGHWITSKTERTKTGKFKRKFVRAELWPVRFKEPQKVLSQTLDRKVGWYKRNSLFMPLVDARTTLLITGVRVQRLQDISEEDSLAEGIVEYDYENGEFGYHSGTDTAATSHFTNPVYAFESLINSINGPDTWAENPWVVACSFKKMTMPN